MLRRALVTGCSGRIGRRLAAGLCAQGVKVLGISHDCDDARYRLDLLRETDRCAKLVKGFCPDVIFHCAALIRGEEEVLCRSNALMLHTIVQGLVRCDKPPCLVNLSSAAELGIVTAECSPVKEDFSCSPVNAYGKSKLVQTESALALSQEHGFRCLCPRVFNVLGGGAQTGTAVGDWCRQIVLMVAGGQKKILKTGDLSLSRDFIEMDAVVQSLPALAACPQAFGIVNVGSGQGTSYRRIVEMLRAMAGIEFEIEEDPALGCTGRRVPEVVADCTKLTGLLGHSLDFNLERALRCCLSEAQ